MLTLTMPADITKYAALIQNDQGEFMVARKHGKDNWINVGGRVERDETPIACLQREIREELNCEIALEPTPEEFFATPPTPALDDPNKTVQIIWYRVTLIGEPQPSGEISEIKWVHPSRTEGIKLSPQIQEFLLPELSLT